MPPYIAPEEVQREGYWGVPTSTLDFCEENYVSTTFIAELWNTLSNAAFIIFALVGLWNCVKYRIETRYLVCHVWLLVIGIGSFLFHCTLRHSMQLLDELPMLVLSAFMLYALLEMGEAKGQPGKWKTARMASLVLYTTVVSLVYVVVNDPTFHEVAYAIMVVMIAALGFWNLGTIGRWRYTRFAVMSFLFYALAFVLWSIDNAFCPSIRAYRATGPFLGGALTQLHAWWHLLAAYGTYAHLVISSRIRMEYLGHQTQFQYFCGIPYLEVYSSQKEK